MVFIPFKELWTNAALVKHWTVLSFPHLYRHNCSPWTGVEKVWTNMLYLLYFTVNEFWVSVQRTEASERCGLLGNYWLKADGESLILKDPKTKKNLLVWPYKLLRRYGRDRVSSYFIVFNRIWREIKLLNNSLDHSIASFPFTQGLASKYLLMPILVDMCAHTLCTWNTFVVVLSPYFWWLLSSYQSRNLRPLLFPSLLPAITIETSLIQETSLPLSLKCVCVWGGLCANSPRQLARLQFGCIITCSLEKFVSGLVVHQKDI